jgi:hypothetical protein
MKTFDLKKLILINVAGAEEKKESDEREELDFMFDEEMDIPAAKNNRLMFFYAVTDRRSLAYKITGNIFSPLNGKTEKPFF